MPTAQTKAQNFIEDIFKSQTKNELIARLQPNHAPQDRPPSGNTEEAFQKRWEMIAIPLAAKKHLSDDFSLAGLKLYNKNIENYIGTVKVPIGLAGPLRVNGLFAQGDYLFPLATTEAALVASYNRGTNIISQAGGASCVLLNAYVSRCPCFAFRNIAEVGQFLVWINENTEQIKDIANATTRFGKLIDFKFSIEGNRVFMCFDYYTADASGQNMVTIATQAAFDFINATSPIKPLYSFVESNMSGDKKASSLAFQNTRGRKVVAETIIPKKMVAEKLHTSVDMLVQFCTTSATGGFLSGTMGVQGHYANALAALYIACGQDAACVSESSNGVTRFEKTPEGDLYAAVTLPNIMVGTVGGGTQLPSQLACLTILGMSGAGHANELAEAVAGLCLAGEISISAALASDTFTAAHHQLARVRTASYFNKN